MKIPLKKGDYVVLYVTDHVEDGDRLMHFTVAGRILKKGPKYISLASWYVHSDEETQKENNKVFTVATKLVEGWAPIGRWHGSNPNNSAPNDSL